MNQGQTPLDAWMEAHGYSDRTLGEKLGYDRSLIFRVRKGVRQPYDAFILRFQRAFGHAEREAVFGPQAPQEEAE